jgi:broad specificity phosphatase PhoE
VLILARHGQSKGNAAGVLLGRADSPLTDLGQTQAASIGLLLATDAERRGRVPARIISSPLNRARQTADSIFRAIEGASGTAPAVEVDDRWIELDYGELDESTLSAVPQGVWSSWRADRDWRPPGGETLVEVAERVRQACLDVAPAALAGDVVVVSHVTPIKAAVAWALGSGIETSWRMSLSVASITRLTMAPSSAVLASFNETSHLSRS